MAEAGRRHPAEQATSNVRELRSVAQLRMLHSLAARLNRLNDVGQIGDAVTSELKTLIDYHNCRIYLLSDDGVTLEPIVFRGELTEYEGETYEELVAKVGEGITGHVAETGESFYTPNALEVDFAVQIAGTSEVVESILAVPLLSGDRVTGVIVLSNLGYDEFDEQDMRLLEVLASHAAVAFENARLFQREREAAETSSALLRLSQVLTGAHDVDAVLVRTVAEIPGLLPASQVAAYVRDPETGAFTMTYAEGVPPRAEDVTVDADTAVRFLQSIDEPFVLPRETVAEVPAAYRLTPEPRAVLVAPLRWEPDGFAALVVVAADGDGGFVERDLRLARGIADITSLALGSARRFHELERFRELVQSLEAVFWEADPVTRRFRFLSRRAERVLSASGSDVGAPQRWGDHIDPEDRDRALAALREAVEGNADRHVEYRTVGGGGEPVWLRDVIHVVRDPQRDAVALRGLMVDITQRKQAEQTLRQSERKYSEAFRREREATQRLRALDEMKNTFLEAVSHDLRTPLTSILGSALTLEQAGLDLPAADSLDLIHRIAGNARKLEKLLSDLLDLDRLQRGIVSPQRRPTDLSALVEHAVRESDLVSGHPVILDLESVVVSIDAAKAERIVENLLANAGRHTPAGTRLWVRVKPKDGGALLVVEDEGPGVPPELKEAVFEPFRQGRTEAPHSPGVGVGLSLVARFAELHGGRAWVEDRPGGGASFRVFLPDG
jgi:PAS domain S-box-containing protein